MSKPYETYEEVKNKLMQNPKLKEEFGKNKPYYDIAMEMVRIRCEDNLTQAQLAKRLETTQSVVLAIESLNIENIKLSTLYKVAKSLNFEVEIKLIPAA